MRMISHSYDTYDEATRAVSSLEAAGVPHSDISIVSGDKSHPAHIDTTDAAATGAGTGATIGTVLGGGAGLLAGIGALAIPGIGPIVAAGWLIAAVTGAGVGAAAGGLAGSLTGAGVSEADANTYADHVSRGGTLVTVQASDAMAAEAEHILQHGVSSTAMPMEAAMVDPVLGMPTATPVAVAPVSDGARLSEDAMGVRRPTSYPLAGTAADGFRERTGAARLDG